VNTKDPETVILVHGLWMHGIAFVAQRYWLAQNGFAVRTFSYPSVRLNLDENSRLLSGYLATISSSTINIVAHSLGGLVVLNMLAQTSAPRIRRVVLMGSPCSGSHCASVLLRTPLLSMIVGRSIRDSMARTRWEVAADVDIGVLAGNISLGLGRIIPGLPMPNDGTVSVEETRLAGSCDSIILPVSHSQMLVSPACASQAACFLKTGHFSHA
jgi:pimeloyl-ACP methyl ester carboxylesterase